MQRHRLVPALGRILVLGVFLGSFPAGLPAQSPAAVDDAVLAKAAESLRLRLEGPSSSDALVVAGERLRASASLAAFYADRLYAPAWISGDGGARIDGLLRALARADSHGLRSGDYHLEALLRLRRRLSRSLDAAPDAGVLGDLDLLLTDAVFLYGGHLVSGRVDPATFDREWQAERKEIDMVAWAERAARSAAPARSFDELLPLERGYANLRRALREHRAMEPWPLPTPFDREGQTLRVGDRGERMLELRLRLAASGDLGLAGTGTEEGVADDATLFDSELEAAVKRFQSRHGLAADGVVGEKTLAVLRVPLADRVAQLETNLERWRWLPRDLGERHLLVNVPAFTLQVVEGEAVVLEMAAVVGRRHRRTPVMSDLVRYLVLNPFWEVPHQLAVEDKLPEIRKDPSYLAREGFELLRGWGAEEERVDPAGVSWSELGRGDFPYRLRQNPGPRNALGRIKFMFPNRFNVYIHDTPSREVFARPERAASSGCIRVEKPLELAEWLLRGSPWDRPRLEAAVAGGETSSVSLPQPVPVHLEYWTAWVEEGPGEGDAGDPGDNRIVHFRADVYGRDAALAAALEARTVPPDPAGSE